MTYIIAGKLKDRTFMMVDAIITNEKTRKKTFRNKLVKLDSSYETYYSMSGIAFIDNCIRVYDDWLSQNNKENDFITGEESIKRLIKIIDKMLASCPVKVKLNSNKIFFINKESVVYYKLIFDKNNKLLGTPKRYKLSTGQCINSIIDAPIEKCNFNLENIEMSCEDYLNKMPSKQIPSKEVDFKERFSFIELAPDKSPIRNYPNKRFSDFIAECNEIDFDSIDNNNFKWNI